MAVKNSSGARPGRKRADKNEFPPSFLPMNNPRSRTAYLFALFGLIPGLGLPLGIIAIIFGILGYRAAKSERSGNGLGHAIVSLILVPWRLFSLQSPSGFSRNTSA